MQIPHQVACNVSKELQYRHGPFRRPTSSRSVPRFLSLNNRKNCFSHKAINPILSAKKSKQKGKVLQICIFELDNGKIFKQKNKITSQIENSKRIGMKLGKIEKKKINI